MDGPDERDVAELGRIARSRMGDAQIEIEGGVIRLNGQDATVAVARTEYDDERPMVFQWGGSLHSWRYRRDLDADYVAGLIEWRRCRERRDGE